SARADPALLREHLADRQLHRDGALGPAPQAEGAGPRRYPRRGGGRRIGVLALAPGAWYWGPVDLPPITHRKEHAMPEKVNNLQDMFLNSLRRSKTPVTMFLVKGVKLQGIITWFDNFSVLLRRDGQAQLIYKHAISTIMPAQPIDRGGLQEAFA